MKRIFSIICIFLFIIVLSGCSESTYNYRTDKYEYLNDMDYMVLYPGLTDQEIDKYYNKFYKKLGYELPEEYKEFLSYTNGLSYDDRHFYPYFKNEIHNNRYSEEFFDLININNYYKNMLLNDGKIILGNDSISFYIYDVNKKKYCILDNGPSLTLDSEYDTFYDMLREALK